MKWVTSSINIIFCCVCVREGRKRRKTAAKCHVMMRSAENENGSRKTGNLPLALELEGLLILIYDRLCNYLSVFFFAAKEGRNDTNTSLAATTLLLLDALTFQVIFQVQVVVIAIC